MKPRRIQLRRTKGWRMPPNTVAVSRPSKWGNPWRKGLYSGYTPAEAVARYEDWIQGDFSHWTERDFSVAATAGKPPTIEEIRRELGGKDLACWCSTEPWKCCHADVLLEIANSQTAGNPAKDAT